MAPPSIAITMNQDVSMDDGRVYTMGARDVASGSLECMLQVFKDILGDMHDLYGAENMSESLFVCLFVVVV